jgi:hypothetical protein
VGPWARVAPNPWRLDEARNGAVVARGHVIGIGSHRLIEQPQRRREAIGMKLDQPA